MEVVLDLYQSQHTEEEPLVCMDEAAITIDSDVYEPIEMKPAQDALVRLSLRARRDKSSIYVHRSHVKDGEELAVENIELELTGQKRLNSF